MNKTVRNWCVVLAIVVMMAVVFAVGRSPTRDVAMPDGTVLHVVSGEFGRRDNIPPEPWLDVLKAKVSRLLPKKWAQRTTASQPGFGPGSWNQVSEVHTNADALHIWISRKLLRTGQFVDSNISFGELLDEHGCPLISTQAGGVQNAGANGTYNVTWLTFEAFPRNQKEFRLRVFEQGRRGLMGEFTLRNPAYRSAAKANWTVEPYPVTKTLGEVSFTLTGITIQTNGDYLERMYPNVSGPRDVVPAFTVTERGQPSQEWSVGDFDLWDCTGNFASEWPPKSRFLCPEVPAWKLVVKFYGSEKSASASNETWTLKGLKVPGPGEAIPLNETRELLGMKVRAIAVAGPGETIYTNDYSKREIGYFGTTPADPERVLTNSFVQSRTTNSVQRVGTLFETYRLASRHLSLEVKALTGDRLLTVTATDDQGRSQSLHEWFLSQRRETEYLYRRYEKNPVVLLLDLAPDAKTVDLAITMHKATVVEFVVKPQGR